MSQSTNRACHVLREGQGSPLVLFHGITCSGHVWRPVIQRLALRHDVIVPTALGHRGGAQPERFPVRIADLVDDAERCLDRLGIERAHLAGNSMGGWIALELARRGRARSVCALSPAGIWRDGRSAGGKLGAIIALTRATRPLLPFFARSGLFRRLALRDNASHGDRVKRDELVRLADDMLDCSAASDLLATDEALTPLKADCPVTLAWSENDRIFPIEEHRALAQQLIPDARFIVLQGVGHVPMLDDPALVAQTILETTREVAGASHATQAWGGVADLG